jgi:hypothetical protein
MTQLSADLALLDSALAAVERLLLEPSDAAQRTEGNPASPAQSSLRICLNSAAALLDVSRSLLRTPSGGATPNELEHEWKTLIELTKSASRSVYRATLIMAAQKNLVAAQVPQALSDDAVAH